MQLWSVWCYRYSSYNYIGTSDAVEHRFFFNAFNHPLFLCKLPSAARVISINCRKCNAIWVSVGRGWASICFFILTDLMNDLVCRLYDYIALKGLRKLLRCFPVICIGAHGESVAGTAESCASCFYSGCFLFGSAESCRSVVIVNKWRVLFYVVLRTGEQTLITDSIFCYILCWHVANAAMPLVESKNFFR